MVRRSNLLVASFVAGVAVVAGVLAGAQVVPPKAQDPPKAPAKETPRKPADPAAKDDRAPPKTDAKAADRKSEDRRERAKGLGFKLDANTEKGLVVSTIEEDSVAAEAGLRAQDRIVSVDGRAFRNQRQLQAYLGGQFGRRVPLIIERGGQRYSVQMPMGEASDGAWLGVYLQENDEGQSGAVVTQIYPAGPAARAGLRSGDVIMKVNGRDVESSADLIGLIEEMEPRAKADLAVRRGKQDMTVAVTLGSRESFVYHRGGEEFDDGDLRRGDHRDDDFYSNIPPYAMQMEHDRRNAEQHERMENAILKLQEEVRKLREAIEKKN